MNVQQAAAQLSRLSVNGQKIVNASGQEVILKGVGLGSWLLMEGYQIKPDFQGGGTQWSIKKRLYDQGVSDTDVEAFFQSWRDNFITKADVDYIASLGFNCIRLPMHYELFLTGAQRAVRNSVARNSGNYNNYVNNLTSWYNSNALFNDANLEGFRTIDSLLNWAGANNMYVVLDLHAAPGAQGTDANISDALVGNDLWNRSIYRDITVRLWQRISARYINDNRVAFYDLINEPNNVPSNPPIHDLFERLINTIRGNGDTHALMIEGNGFGNNYDYMEPWTFTNRQNLIYNAHRYWITNSITATDPNPNQIHLIGSIVNFRNRHNVPVWVGETGENNNDWLRENITNLNSLGIGWCHWTYKRFDWNANAALMRINPPYLMDGAWNMSAVLNSIKFANCIPNPGTIAAVAPGKPSVAPIGRTIWLQGSNGLYVSSENGTQAMNCNRPTAQGWEQFYIADAGNGKITLMSMGKYVSSENAVQAMTCNRAIPQEWEMFDWFDNGDGTISLRGWNGMFVSSENGVQPMNCNRPAIQDWEKFRFGFVGAARMMTTMESPAININQAGLVYPNPVQRGALYTVKVKQYNANAPVRVTVMDLSGKTIAQYNAGKAIINIPAAANSGVYMLKISNGTNNYIEKIVVR
jgi:aryl-phospho-beta-D-glucosidase BglC (GH1 family)